MESSTKTGVWDVRPLSSFANSISSGKTTERVANGKYTLFGSTGPIGTTNTPEFDGPSILVARVGANAGSVYQVDGCYGVSDNTLVVRLASEQDVRFFAEVLRSMNLNTMVYGSGQPLVTGSMLKRLSIPVLSGDEQTVIACVLVDADELISALERLIAKRRAMKQGMMQHLLTGNTRLPGFVGEWCTFRLAELGSFLKGRGIKRDDVRRTGVPCIRYGEIYTTFADYTSSTVSFVDRQVANEALPIRAGDLLFAASGETHEEIGKCIAFTGAGPAVAGGDIVVLRGTTFNPAYLASLTNTPAIAAQKAKRGQGDAVVHLSSRALGDIEVNLPPKDEQDAIAAMLIDVNDEVDVLHSRLAKAKAIKMGMMQELLTGRTRLLVEKGAA
jgi:type I restriction enzyme, S subunit